MIIDVSIDINEHVDTYELLDGMPSNDIMQYLLDCTDVSYLLYHLSDKELISLHETLKEVIIQKRLVPLLP